MLRTKKVAIAWGALGFLAATGSTSHSQVFLDKLEAAVREHLEDAPETPVQTEMSEELPLPRSNDSENSPQRSDLEYPLSNLPMNTPADNTSLLEQSATDSNSSPVQGVYLGLEAAEVSGGGLGISVVQVTNGSPAWKSGIKVNDRIVAINGNAVANLDDMVGHVSTAAPGDVMRFLVSRDGRNMEIVTVLMGRELAAKIAEKAYGTPMPPQTATRQPEAKPWLGVLASDLTDAFKQQFRIAAFKGAAVTQVSKGGPASKAGIMPGDVIIEANGRPIQSAADLTRWIQETKIGDRYEVVVQRGAIARVVEVAMTSKTTNSTRGLDSNQTSSQAIPNALPMPLETPTNQSQLGNSSAIQPLEFSAGGSELSPLEQERLRADMLQSEVDTLRDQLHDSETKLQDLQKRMNQLLEVLQK